jgi:hypothetical protein
MGLRLGGDGVRGGRLPQNAVLHCSSRGTVTPCTGLRFGGLDKRGIFFGILRICFGVNFSVIPSSRIYHGNGHRLACHPTI